MIPFSPSVFGEKIRHRYTLLGPYLPALFFITGFIFDLVTLGRIDNILTIISHGAYLALIIVILHKIILDKQPSPSAGRLSNLFHEYMNEALHFLLGALLNAFTIFYFKSGSIANSFFLLLFLSLLLIFNEMNCIKKQGPAIKVAILKLSLISYFLYLVPTVAGRTGNLVFFSSLVCSSLIIAAVYFILRRQGIATKRINYQLLSPSVSVVVIFVLLYLLRIIPPVPLSLKHIGIYHGVEKSGLQYIVSRQTPPWKFWSRGDQHFKAGNGDRIYLFTTIFSPGGFKDRVFIHFQLFDHEKGWTTTDRIPLPIVGGREEGYRGYAYKQNYIPGSWRALIETGDSLEIGRIAFDVTLVDEVSTRNLYTEIY